MGYYEEFQRILAEVPRTPEDEEQTKQWVIEPTLQALGYAASDVLRVGKNDTGLLPDYTVLLNSSRKWLLEAKPWNADLTDENVAQAMRYAGAEERRVRWIVLTNGHEWRLYDTEQTVPNGQLAICATKDDAAAMEALLDALSRERVLSGGIEAAVRAFRLRNCLCEALHDERGSVIRSLQNVARREAGLANVTRSEVARAIREIMAQSPPPSSEPEPQSDEGPMTPSETAQVAEAWHALSDPDLNPTGRKIVAVRFPDQTVPVRYWRDLWIEAVEWLDAHAQRPVPVPWHGGSRQGGRVYINNAPMDRRGKPIIAPKEVGLRSGLAYLELRLSATNALRVTRALCEELGVDPAQVWLQLG